MNIPELQTLAQAASIGRWFAPERVEADEFYGEYFELPWDEKYLDGGGLFCSDEVGAFIAACDPQTVLALTEAVEAARNYLDGHDRRGDKLRDALAELEVAA